MRLTAITPQFSDYPSDLLVVLFAELGFDGLAVVVVLLLRARAWVLLLRGARGLRSICERVLQDVMYDLPEHKVATHVVVRASDIAGETVPEIVPAS